MKAKGSARSAVLRVVVLVAITIITGSLLWWVLGRVTADARKLRVHRVDTVEWTPPARDGEIRVLAWNIAHGRGDAGNGWFQNWRGGTPEERVARLARIASVLRSVAADVVVLNEVDFRAAWSGGLDQAEILARAAGYPSRVEQRNFDVRIPTAGFAFGNAVLSRFPIRKARWLGLPAHSWVERLVLGSKAAAVVELKTPIGPVTVVPIHLEFRSAGTRLGAVEVLDGLRGAEPAPLVLAGDFNASPPAWPDAGERTVPGELLERGWRSPRAGGPPRAEEFTFPAGDPTRALDWILVEPPLRVREVRVLREGGELSDHLPVLAVVERSSGRRRPDPRRNDGGARPAPKP